MQNAVFDDRIGDTRREAVKRKLNSAISKIWTAQPWGFKRRPALAITVPYDATRRPYVLTTSEAVEEILGCFNEDGVPLTPLPNDRFEEEYESVTDHGDPVAFSIYGEGTCLMIRFGPSPASAKSYRLPYNAGPPTLSADANDLATYGWPAYHHELVVVDARIAMLRDENDPTWRELAPERRELYDAMVDALVADQGGTTGEFGADPLAYEVV